MRISLIFVCERSLVTRSRKECGRRLLGKQPAYSHGQLAAFLCWDTPLFYEYELHRRYPYVVRENAIRLIWEN